MPSRRIPRPAAKAAAVASRTQLSAPLMKREVLKKIYGMHSSGNYNKSICAIMFQMARDTPDAELSRFYNKIDEIQVKLNKQFRLFKPGKIVNTTRTTELDISQPHKNIKVTFFFLIWLDTIHDNYNKLSFGKWLKKSAFVKNLTNGKGNEIFRILNFPELSSEQPIIYNIVSILKLNISNGSDIPIPTQSGWEGKLKVRLKEIFSEEEEDVKENDIRTQGLQPSFIKHEFQLNKDQEGEHKPLSELAAKTKNGLHLKVKPATNIANVLDPGKKMPGIGYFYGLNPYYNESPFLMNLYDLMQFDVNLPYFNVKVKSEETTPPYTGLNGIKKIDFFKVLINDEESLIGSTRAEASSNNAANKSKKRKKRANKEQWETEVGKFLGDFVQILICTIRHSEVIKVQNGKNHARAFGSGDGMACVMCYFISKYFLNTPPCMVVDVGGTVNKEVRFYGLEEFIDRTVPQVFNKAEQSLLSGNEPIDPLKNMLSKFVETNKQQIKNLYTQQFNGNKEASTGQRDGNKMSKIQFIKLLRRILKVQTITNRTLNYQTFINTYFNPEIIRLNEQRKGKGIAQVAAWPEQVDPMSVNRVVTNESGGAGPSQPQRTRRPGGKERNANRAELLRQQAELLGQLRDINEESEMSGGNAESNEESEMGGNAEPNFRQMLTNLNNSGLVSRLSDGNKTKIIQHLKKYYQENNDNENNRRQFIKEISYIIQKGPSAGVFAGNNPNIQNYLKNNSIKKGEMVV